MRFKNISQCTKYEQEFREVIWLILRRLFCGFSCSLVLKVEITLPVCILAKLFLEPREGLNKRASLTLGQCI